MSATHCVACREFGGHARSCPLFGVLAEAVLASGKVWREQGYPSGAQEEFHLARWAAWRAAYGTRFLRRFMTRQLQVELEAAREERRRLAEAEHAAQPAWAREWESGHDAAAEAEWA